VLAVGYRSFGGQAGAARLCAAARLVNGGQSCIAAKRFIVVTEVIGAFEAAPVEEMRGYAMEDPFLDTSWLGPMVSVDARDKIHAQVEASVSGGARLLLGGAIPKRIGAWYPPTVLGSVTPGQPAHDDEVFGPVAAVIKAANEEDAIRDANASRFGLGGGVLTADLARGERIAAERLDAGAVFVNGNVRSDPRMPFGGVKNRPGGRCPRHPRIRQCQDGARARAGRRAKRCPRLRRVKASLQTCAAPPWARVSLRREGRVSLPAELPRGAAREAGCQARAATLRSRKSRISGTIVSSLSSSAKWPVSSMWTSASGRSRR
jgi:Aldehyde dehydrogenase family